jgi:hypothetical protein
MFRISLYLLNEIIFLLFMLFKFYSTSFRFKSERWCSFSLFLLWLRPLAIFCPLQFFLKCYLSCNVFKWRKNLRFSEVLGFLLTIITQGCARLPNGIYFARYFFGHTTVIQSEQILTNFVIVKWLETTMIMSALVLIIRSFLIWEWFKIVYNEIRFFWRLKCPKIIFLLPISITVFLLCYAIFFFLNQRIASIF